MNRIAVFVVTLLLFLPACKGGKETSQREGRSDVRLQKEPPLGAIIPVGHCRIVATITAVDTINGPCEQSPCKARAMVGAILGYGSSFGAPLTVGQEIRLNFAFGLRPVTRFLANDSLVLTGLTTGEAFQADIQGGGGEGPEQGAFTVFAYTKK